MLGGENMCIDDNIPADNYCGIILKAEQQEDTGQHRTKSTN